MYIYIGKKKNKKMYIFSINLNWLIGLELRIFYFRLLSPVCTSFFSLL